MLVCNVLLMLVLVLLIELVNSLDSSSEELSSSDPEPEACCLESEGESPESSLDPDPDEPDSLSSSGISEFFQPASTAGFILSFDFDAEKDLELEPVFDEVTPEPDPELEFDPELLDPDSDSSILYLGGLVASRIGGPRPGVVSY